MTMTLDELRKMRSLPAVETVADAVDGMDLNAVFDLAEAMLMLQEMEAVRAEVGYDIVSKSWLVTWDPPHDDYLRDRENGATAEKAIRAAWEKWKER